MAARPEQAYAHTVQQVHRTRMLRIERSGAPCAFLTLQQLQRCSTLSTAAEALLERSCQRLALSARAVQRILALRRTIAALAQSELIESAQVAEAVQLRRPLDQAQ